MRGLRFALLLFLITPALTLAQSKSSKPARNADVGGARYVWERYREAGIEYPFTPLADFPTLRSFVSIPLDSAQMGDVAWWPSYMAVYTGPKTRTVLTADGAVSLGGAINQLGQPRMFRWIIRPWEVPSNEDIFDVVVGQWGWVAGDATCESNPHTISFNGDRSLMTLLADHDYSPPKDELVKENRKAVYQIRGHTRSSVRGFIVDETRKTDDGELVVWDLVLTSRDSYRWHRADWEERGYTGEIKRCKPESR